VSIDLERRSFVDYVRYIAEIVRVDDHLILNILNIRRHDRAYETNVSCPVVSQAFERHDRVVVDNRAIVLMHCIQVGIDFRMSREQRNVDVKYERKTIRVDCVVLPCLDDDTRLDHVVNVDIHFEIRLFSAEDDQ
jgi:hypothetical protein